MDPEGGDEEDEPSPQTWLLCSLLLFPKEWRHRQETAVGADCHSLVSWSGRPALQPDGMDMNSLLQRNYLD